MSSDPEILAAEAQVQAARSRLFETLGEVQERLKPSNLAQNAVETAAQGVASTARKGAEAVRARPFAAAAIAGTVGLVFARGWIADMLRRRNETAPAADGLSTKTSAKPAKKGPSK
ncbi:DUF3618 domain-containing protein [Sphingomonas sp. LM7]|uniref:DUF3618 domain-containing protein n=1 Tax=Sphingomonas sp. LM7 TaxID=1938607 RepID=UPI000983AC7A|nr:DUF3618 domain-containing protein [Sphingomonas sp. LM7]AQR73212.1 hypothetical protein BXU08_05510 [Sphingomonas sp. LM7]